MKSRMILNGHRPRVESHGDSLMVTLTDVSGSTVEVDMDRSVGYCLEQDLAEARREYKGGQA